MRDLAGFCNKILPYACELLGGGEVKGWEAKPILPILERSESTPLYFLNFNFTL